MRERLPNITIKPDIPPKEFIERLYHLVTRQQVWQIHNFKNIPQDRDNPSILALTYTSSEPKILNGLMAHFALFVHRDKDRVFVDLVTQNWGVEDPTYESYVDAVYTLKPLLSLYNKLHKARVRFNIESREQLAPKLHLKAKEFFDHFVSMANKSALHPSDWGPFYDFVIVCHRVRSKLIEDDIRYLLVKEGFNEEHALKIAGVYGHGREILKRPRDPISIQRWANFQHRSSERGEPTDA